MSYYGVPLIICNPPGFSNKLSKIFCWSFVNLVFFIYWNYLSLVIMLLLLLLYIFKLLLLLFKMSMSFSIICSGLCRELHVQSVEQDLDNALVLWLGHNICPHHIYPCCRRGPKILSLIHFRWQDSWYSFCSTLFHATLPMVATTWHSNPRTLGMVRWCGLSIQSQEAILLCC